MDSARVSVSPTIVALVVSASAEDRLDLQTIFGRSRWLLFEASTAEEAITILTVCQIAVVIADAELPDGTWRNLADRTKSLPQPPLVIVTSDEADEKYWTEVVSLGAHDVLAKPLLAVEVLQTIELAWQQWNAAHPEPS